MVLSKKIAEQKNIAVIVAHPDDETLWCGGLMLMHPEYKWFIASVCRKYDTDRAPKFKKVLEFFNASGIMGDLNDGPEQFPLQEDEVKSTILSLLPNENFDLIITHNPFGEYTRHLRHEEVGRATIRLWNLKKLSTKELWVFAYEDGKKEYYPRAMVTADIQLMLPEEIWKEKYQIITEIYGFEKTGFEASTTPKIEAFLQFKNSSDAEKWLSQMEQHR
ncbi:PIG-L family deacetylase [Aequorivita sp. H23M31]|uniref:PIG-L family deacetylase n=1 Tax=Aequorivita ciconiae TaxID=2494375 RepID=A0A410G766_9FLAO|nr:PIG-L family deacetylase [Aequorivita sp. H23M31]QAA83080.1 PIG-L family deacetylase [Aequorivita sp. H23M31]